MTRSRGAIRRSIPVASLALVCMVSAAASAKEWDAGRALALAAELEETLAEAIEAAQAAPPQETAMQARTRDAAVAEMKVAHAASREFVTRLRIPGEREDTESFFAQVQDRYEGAMQTARDAVPQPTVGPLLEKAESLILSLQKLYTPG